MRPMAIANSLLTLNSTTLLADVHLNNNCSINLSQQSFLHEYVDAILILVECINLNKNLRSWHSFKVPGDYQLSPPEH